MNKKKKSLPALMVVFMVTLLMQVALAQVQPPHIDTTAQRKTLMVNGKPFAILGGELHNSSASDLNYMRPLWTRLQALHLNTVIAPLSWELTEPSEGRYDFSLADGLIRQARLHHLKLVLLWFGAWKNTWSSYAPSWVKKDLIRFPRMVTDAGTLSGALSTFGHQTLECEMKAFASLMEHLRRVDSGKQTVIMVQVENETGVLNSTRDHSPAAERAFADDIPAVLQSTIRADSGQLHPALRKIIQPNLRTWTGAFGSRAGEVFMAWQLATYAEQLARAGKKRYNIPMYVNAWLDPTFGTGEPSGYPLGGPVSQMTDIWKAAAPDIDLFAPDVYIDDFGKVCREFTRMSNPLFIPEARNFPGTSAWACVAFGQYHALGFSAFGIEDYSPNGPLAHTYLSICSLVNWLYSRTRAESRAFQGDHADTAECQIAGVHVFIRFDRMPGGSPTPYIWLVSSDSNELFIAGRHAHVALTALSNAGKCQLEIISHEEGAFRKGHWIAGRRLNGDELDVDLKEEYGIQRLQVQIIPLKPNL